MSKYDFGIEAVENNSAGMILKQIENNSVVLEFGCAEGRMTRYLKENKKCKVYIVEIDRDAFKNASNYAEDGICDNIECLSWVSKFEKIKFDYIIFADVLEHLRNPQKVLEKTAVLLKNDGSVLFSVPNIAHGDIYINIYLNQFKYMPLGLLDNTHVHLFAYEELDKFCDDAGYEIVVKDATIVDLFGTEQAKWIPVECREQLKEKLFGKQYTEIYQFIYKLQKKDYVIDKGIQKVCNIKNNYYGINACVAYKVADQESLCEYIKIYPEIVNENKYEFILALRDNVKELKFCPTRNFGCILTETKILSNQGIIKDYSSNGIQFGNSILFANMAPEITVNLENMDIDYLKISANVRLFNKIDEYQLYSDISEKFAEVSSVIEKSKDEINVFKSKQNSLEADFSTVSNKLKQYSAELEQKEAEKDSLSKENNVYKLKQSSLENDLSKLSYQLKQCLADLEQKETEKDNLFNELQLIKIQNEKTKSDNHAKAIFLKNYMNRCNLNKTNELFEKQGYINYLESKVYELTQKYNDCLNREQHYGETCEPINSTCSLLEQVVKVEKNEVIINGNKKNCFKGTVPNLNVNLSNIEYDKLYPLERIGKKIAVHVHLFYEDLLAEFFNYFNNIPYVFDLYVSCKEHADMEDIALKFSRLRYVNDIIVRPTKNRGRDIAPFYVLFNKEIQQHDFVLHVHSKKSLYSGKEKVSWRKNSLNRLVGNEEIVKRIFSLFESNANIGLLFSENTDIIWHAQEWLANKELGRQLCKEYNVEFIDGFFNYPVGSFFWARVDAIRPVFERNLTYEDFPEESGQTDGTLAHALERFIALLTRGRGYNLAICDYDENIIRLNCSKKAYRDYFNLSPETAFRYLKQFDLVSFDIFDTLITRKIYRPDDLFHVIKYNIKSQLNIDFDFYNVRKEAEQQVWNEKGAGTDIHDIYLKIAEITQFDLDVVEKMKSIEVDTELEYAIPRKDMLEIFNKLRDIGKTIVLVSDMYLTSNIINEILLKCGYKGYHDIWVSCEKKARKDMGDLWKLFLETYGDKKIIHVGDNPRSDIQIPGDLMITTFLVMNPLTQFKMSEQYNYFKEFDTNDLSYSIIMGMLINEKMYNSPFAFDFDGRYHITHENDVGFIAYGALITSFIQWITNRADEGVQLLFLSREGHILQKLFNMYCDEMHLNHFESIYLLASRRSVSVASINEYKDIVKILEQDYSGTLDDLLFHRLNITIDDEILSNIEITMPNDLDNVMALINGKIPEIYKLAQKEREAYLTYTNSVLKKDKKWVVIDVGYSGTIQYFLAKLLAKEIGGLYLCTSNNIKPLEIGCSCEQIYGFTKEKGFSDVQKKSLYLEAALQAPYGQLIKFELDEKNNQSIPVYKNEQMMGRSIELLQKGIEDFMKTYLEMTKNILNGESIDHDFAAELFKQYANSNVLSERLLSIFKIQDDYCTKGILKL